MLQPPLSERSSGDGGSDKECNNAIEDDGGSTSEDIYATITRRKRSNRTCYGGGGYRLGKPQQDITEKNNCERPPNELDTITYEEEEESKEEGANQSTDSDCASNKITFSHPAIQRLQYRDLDIEPSAGDAVTDIDNIDRVIKPSHIKHLVSNIAQE